MSDFKISLKRTLENEGGFVDNPFDSGGRTNYGITQNTYNKYYPGKDVKYRTDEEIERIYKTYWIDLDDQLLTDFYFDFAVNSGPKRACLSLQKVLDIQQDGIFGKNTLKAVKQANKRELFIKYKEERIRFLNAIAFGKNARFLKGWLNRVNKYG